MKKTIYTAPATKLFAVQTSKIIAGSLAVNGTTGHATFYNADATGEAMTKEDYFWDDWDEE